ncbi:MAG: hypothetical protein DPW16_18500 [Chloroflexi bacterium]|nr:hypothetical protein [Chloroflexota bacterium]
MAETVQIKSLNKRYIQVKIDETVLSRLIHILEDTAKGNPQELEIVIESADGQDTIRTTDWKYFSTPVMPQCLKSIVISSGGYRSPVQSRIELISKPYPLGRAEISVKGTDKHAVTGIFHELDRIMTDAETSAKLIVKYADNILIWIIWSFLGAFTVFSIFDFFLDTVAAAYHKFDGSDIYIGIAIFGWICVFIAFLFSPSPIVNFLRSSFPVTEFAGQFSDASEKKRGRLMWFTGIILLPILVNFLSGIFV